MHKITLDQVIETMYRTGMGYAIAVQGDEPGGAGAEYPLSADGCDIVTLDVTP